MTTGGTQYLTTPLLPEVVLFGTLNARTGHGPGVRIAPRATHARHRAPVQSRTLRYAAPQLLSMLGNGRLRARVRSKGFSPSAGNRPVARIPPSP